MSELTYAQRKALRRLSRGQSITNTAARDPIIQSFFTQDFPELPENYNVADWVDWESGLRYTPRRLTPAGLKALKELGETK